MQDETLSHIIANYYGGSGMDKAFVQMAIVKRIEQLLCAQIQIICMLESLCICPRSMRSDLCWLEKQGYKKSGTKRDNREEIFFFGS